MGIALITGSGGLIGSEAALFFAAKGFDIVGIDNDMRKYFFGQEASTSWNIAHLTKKINNYQAIDADIRDQEAMENVFRKYGKELNVIIHTAAQPSHDWAASEPLTDFTINANGTLILLEMTRKFCPEARFIFTSTNKVYGDASNRFPFEEKRTRWELASSHHYFEKGIDESFPIDQSKHSLFGASKVAADILVQEYGRYFGMNTVCFRSGCMTGPNHSSAESHGFLAYLMKCTITNTPYSVFGYKGKQVRDNIHSRDFVNMLWHYYQNPRPGEVYNAGGGRHSNCSMLEAIEICERISGKKLSWQYDESSRVGDHIWWISDLSKFSRHYPDWHYTYGLEDIVTEIFNGLVNRV